MQDFACKVTLQENIFPENFMKIDQEMAEKIANQTMKKNNNKQGETVE